MNEQFHNQVCAASSHFNRRTLLKAAGLSGACWLTPIAQALGQEAEKSPRGKPAKSVILLWMIGGPSQLETFDPHPGTKYGGDTVAIDTNVKGIQFGSGLARTAEQMDSLAVIRSVTSKEGDHERAVYNIKSGFRPDPTLVHPSIGSVICHQTEAADKGLVEIPRHISILPQNNPGRGGYLGNEYDAFKVNDPKDPINDLARQVDQRRFDRRMKTLEDIVENEFARGRPKSESLVGSRKSTTQAALKMMSSEQLKAFDLKDVPEGLKAEFGDTPFGRGCLAAIRLIETGVRCVEVTLGGWDTHANNHELQHGRLEILDPAFAALIRNLKDRGLYDDTIVLCGGEFGRTPSINPAGGRDHWPHGFSIALGGGGLRSGITIGQTSPNPIIEPKKQGTDLVDPWRVEDVHATILEALAIDWKQELQTPVGRPMAISNGKLITELLG